MTTGIRTSIVQAHGAATVAAGERFFAAEADRIAECCRQMAARFAAGGTLFVAGVGAQASDAQHVSVEFVHPIIVGKRALPAVALTSDFGVLTATASAADAVFDHALGQSGRPEDVLLALCAEPIPRPIERAMACARQMGVLTVLICGAPPSPATADLAFVIGETNPLVAQEVMETLYHVLWELVHVFLDADDAHDSPFASARDQRHEHELTVHVVASIHQKARDVIALRRTVLADSEFRISAAGAAIAARLQQRGRLYTFGNGGSATDAQDAAIDAMSPPIAGWRSIPARALSSDVGVLTAIANDVGIEHVFARQLAAFGRPADVAVAFSTSGASRNILAGMAAARARGLLTIAMVGGDGGPLARSADVEICFVAPSEHLPRIQEAHATLWHALLAATQEALS